MQRVRNERGAGRKPLPYKSQNLRVPEPILEDVKAMVKAFKQQQKQGA